MGKSYVPSFGHSKKHLNILPKKVAGQRTRKKLATRGRSAQMPILSQYLPLQFLERGRTRVQQVGRPLSFPWPASLFHRWTNSFRGDKLQAHLRHINCLPGSFGESFPSVMEKTTQNQNPHLTQQPADLHPKGEIVRDRPASMMEQREWGS